MIYGTAGADTIQLSPHIVALERVCGVPLSTTLYWCVQLNWSSFTRIPAQVLQYMAVSVTDDKLQSCYIQSYPFGDPSMLLLDMSIFKF